MNAKEPFRGDEEVKETEQRYDPLSQTERSIRMSKIKQKNTKPELFIRKLVHGLGYRYRLHRSDLPGHPDLVFPGRKKVIFVNGCFWHLHGCSDYRMPKTKLDFWIPKLERNKARDEEVRKALEGMGWRHLTVWTCQLKKTEYIVTMITQFLEDGGKANGELY